MEATMTGAIMMGVIIVTTAGLVAMVIVAVAAAVVIVAAVVVVVTAEAVAAVVTVVAVAAVTSIVENKLGHPTMAHSPIHCISMYLLSEAAENVFYCTFFNFFK